VSRESLAGSFYPSQNNKQEGKKYEKTSLNCIGGKWIRFRFGAAY